MNFWTHDLIATFSLQKIFLPWIRTLNIYSINLKDTRTNIKLYNWILVNIKSSNLVQILEHFWTILVVNLKMKKQTSQKEEMHTGPV